MPHAEVIRLPVQPPKLANPDSLQPAELRAELRRANDLLMDMTLQLAVLQNALCNSVRHGAAGRRHHRVRAPSAAAAMTLSLFPFKRKSP